MQFFPSLLILAAALQGALAATGDIIEGAYIVMLKPETPEPEFEAHCSWAAGIQSPGVAKGSGNGEFPEGVLKHTYLFGTMKGYVGTFDNKTIEEIATRPEVNYIEPDRVVSAANPLITQFDAGPGLGRISHRRPSVNYVYSADADNCNGTTAYVIDTGVLATHEQFQGRAINVANFVDGVPTDENGHGTHVAGIIGGRDFGVCKEIELLAIKVLGADGFGTLSGVIAGVQYAATDAANEGRRGASVANMSLSSLRSAALNLAVNNAIDSGLPIAVAAGNSDAEASNYSPASVPIALTVAAIDPTTDVRAGFSNFGPSVDLFAPGVNILSAYIGSNDAVAVLSGTSMASPFVAGVVAYFLGLFGALTPCEVTELLLDVATRGRVIGPGPGSPNAIVFNNATATRCR